MTVIGTLWGDVRQRQTKVILSVAALNGFELNQPPFSFQEKPADFTEKFLYGKIPAFEDTDGFKLIEGAPIARYLSSIGTEVQLLGSNAKEAALIDQWIHFAEHEISTPTYAITGLVYGYAGPFSREALDKSTERLVRALKHLESHLETRSTAYITSDSLTLGDLFVASTTYFISRIALGISERKQYPAIYAHYEKVTGDKKIEQYWGTSGFVDERLTEPTPITAW